MEVLENLVASLSQRLAAAEARLAQQQPEGPAAPPEGVAADGRRRLSEPQGSEASIELGHATLATRGDTELNICHGAGGAINLTIAGNVQVDGTITELGGSEPHRPRDCQALLEANSSRVSGHEHVWPHGPSGSRVEVFCDYVGSDGWMVVVGAENRINHCSVIEGDCDEAATGYSIAVAGAHMLERSKGVKTASPSSPKFCCDATLAIADQVSYHRKFCGRSGGYNNAHVVFCIERSWLSGLPIGALRVMSIHTSTANQPWGTAFRDTRGNYAGGWNASLEAYDVPGDGSYHTLDVSALGDARSTWTSVGGAGRVELHYLAFKLR